MIDVNCRRVACYRLHRLTVRRVSIERPAEWSLDQRVHLRHRDVEHVAPGYLFRRRTAMNSQESSPAYLASMSLPSSPSWAVAHGPPAS
jgi:hypothetical protein